MNDFALDFQRTLDAVNALSTIDFPLGRTGLQSDLTLYVRTDGNDANDGLANTAAGAFLTIQRGVDVASRLIDGRGQNITIQVADGTYSMSSTITLRRFLGTGTITLQGNTATPANCIISQTGAGVAGITATSDVSDWVVQGFRLNGTGSTGVAITISSNCSLQIGNIQFNTGWSSHIAVTANSSLNITAACSILAGGVTHITVQRNSHVRLAAVITLTGTPAFSARFAYITVCSSFVSVGGSYSGAATGTRHLIDFVSAVTGAGAVTFFPGSVAGVPNALSTLSATGGVIA